MASVTGIADIATRHLQGKGVQSTFFVTSSSGQTAATAASGHFGNSLNFNSIGSTVPGTLVGLEIPNATDELLCTSVEASLQSGESIYLGYLYRIGVIDFTSTSGNRLTHDGTFTRLRRTRFATANSNINMIPLIYMTTAASVTQAAYTFGYVNQSGSSVTSPSNSLPAAATAVQSTYNLIMNEGDSSVLDITTVTVTTATTGGIASLFGFEVISKIQAPFAGGFSFTDSIYGGLNLSSLNPASPDAGSVTSYLAVLSPSLIGTTPPVLFVRGVNNA